MNILSSISELLIHIKSVEQDTIKMSQESIMMLDKFIENNDIELDENAAMSLQYQDIISQQLTATIEAMDNIQNSLKVFESSYKIDNKLSSGSFVELNEKISKILEVAKDKKDAYSGKLGSHNQEEIEFF